MIAPHPVHIDLTNTITTSPLNTIITIFTQLCYNLKKLSKNVIFIKLISKEPQARLTIYIFTKKSSNKHFSIILMRIIIYNNYLFTLTYIIMQYHYIFKLYKCKVIYNDKQ